MGSFASPNEVEKSVDAMVLPPTTMEDHGFLELPWSRQKMPRWSMSKEEWSSTRMGLVTGAPNHSFCRVDTIQNPTRYIPHIDRNLTQLADWSTNESQQPMRKDCRVPFTCGYLDNTQNQYGSQLKTRGSPWFSSCLVFHHSNQYCEGPALASHLSSLSSCFSSKGGASFSITN